MSSKTRIAVGLRHAAAQARTPEGSALAVAILGRVASSRSLEHLNPLTSAQLQHEVGMLAAFGPSSSPLAPPQFPAVTSGWP